MPQLRRVIDEELAAMWGRQHDGRTALERIVTRGNALLDNHSTPSVSIHE